MTEKQSLLGKLLEYSESDMYPFHMPGHKRREIEDDWIHGFPDPYSVDITEIEGFDNLHHAEGILKDAMDQAARIYGADQTAYLVNGSTSGILSAVFAAVPHGGKILIARNCHKSAYHGLILGGFRPVYVYPRVIESLGFAGEINPSDISSILEEDRQKYPDDRIKAILIVSPTYEGIVSNICEIAEISHSYGIPLIVDEAHGAHLPFASEKDGYFPDSAIHEGADLVIQSLHKTLPCFTQTAIIHRKSSYVTEKQLSRYLGMFQTSSPSYIFMAGIERCIRYMAEEGQDQMKKYGRKLTKWYESLHCLKVLKVMTKEMCQEIGIYDWDFSKIVISVADAADMDGEKLGKILRECYHLEVEMTAPSYVIAMTSFMDTDEGMIRLREALIDIDHSLQRAGDRPDMREMERNVMMTAEVVKTPAEAFHARTEQIPLEDSAGRVSAEFIYVYPPGIPVIAPGEKITEDHIRLVRAYQKAGLPVQGPESPDITGILALADPERDMIQ